MDWLIFGDDWGVHSSTTQHLARNLPLGDRIIWLNSIGMRSPALSWSDLSRLFSKGLSGLGRKNPKLRQPPGSIPDNIQVIAPFIFPWHSFRPVVSMNSVLLQASIRRAMAKLQIQSFHVLTANPVAGYYLKGLPVEDLAYLRLDNYPELPGVDAQLVRSAEQNMFKNADQIFATALQLLPSTGTAKKRSTYLPQGVDWDHFASVPVVPPGSKILGFYGLLAEWMDFDLIKRVADQMAEWTLQLMGPVRTIPEDLGRIKNIKVLPAVPYDLLPQAIEKWDAAWIPFQVNKLTRSVNPLKLREYLAAGLPTLCTPLPEAVKMAPWVKIASTPEQVSAWLRKIVGLDNPEKRQQRRKVVSSHSWSARAQLMRSCVENGSSRIKKRRKEF